MGLDKILVLDFGSQYTQLITRRVRELGAYCEIFPYDVQISQIKHCRPKALILSGGPASAVGSSGARVNGEIFHLDIPILGLCYGMQVMAAQLGGKVETGRKREYGPAIVRARGHSRLLKNIEDRQNESGHGLLDVWMSHGDSVTEVPKDFITIASNESTPIAGIADEKRNFYGLQFHPEVTHTRRGGEILQRFITDIAKISNSWSMPLFVPNAVNKIRERIGSDKVILGLSGGVDSSVTAALLKKAIDHQVTCIFVDNGLLRLNESLSVMEIFSKNLELNIIHVDARQQFMSALKGITDPEEKRKIIGKEFIKVFEKESDKLNDIKWLAQGTIYPDVIESAGANSNKAVTIKSHHNVGGLPDKLNLKLIEPLRDLFKDEVRKLGIELGLPESMVYRHPFPGPGLGVRILGEVRFDFAEILRHADAIFIEELKKSGWYPRVSQAFAVFLPVRSVGVMGDGRTYEYVVALRAVETTDFMTATWSQLPSELLEKVSSRIINEVKGINRVVYDISSKPPATIEWE